MSKYYNPQRKPKSCFDPASKEPFKLSRSRIELFLNCPHCFYLDRRLGVDRPPGYPFSLNSAVDKLLKKEFDAYRLAGKAHQPMEQFGINAVTRTHTRAHEKMDEWRDALHGGVTFLHKSTNLFITGGVDDIWIKPNGELIVIKFYQIKKVACPTARVARLQRAPSAPSAAEFCTNSVRISSHAQSQANFTG